MWGGGGGMDQQICETTDLGSADAGGSLYSAQYDKERNSMRTAKLTLHQDADCTSFYRTASVEQRSHIVLTFSTCNKMLHILQQILFVPMK